MNRLNVTALNEALGIDGPDFIDEDESCYVSWKRAPSVLRGTTWDEERHTIQKEEQAYFFTKEHQSAAGKKGGRNTKDNNSGIFSPSYNRTPAAKKGGKIGGTKQRDLKLGFHGMSAKF